MIDGPVSAEWFPEGFNWQGNIVVFNESDPETAMRNQIYLQTLIEESGAENVSVGPPYDSRTKGVHPDTTLVGIYVEARSLNRDRTLKEFKH